MKKKNIVLFATLFAMLCVFIIKDLLVTPYANIPSTAIKSKFEITDVENKFKMLFPDSVIKKLNETIIAGVPCKITHYSCNPANTKIALMIIRVPEGTNDKSLENVFNSYFYTIDSGQVFKAGKLDGLKYNTFICGVKVENFIGISGNKIYHYSETLAGETPNLKANHLNSLLIDANGQNIKALLVRNKEQADIKTVRKNPIQTKGFEVNLKDGDIAPENMNTIRIDIPLKTFQANPDTVLYFLKQQYYALEHTFQKSISCNFENGTSKETIVYPNINYTLKLFEKKFDDKPYQTINRFYTGNTGRK